MTDFAILGFLMYGPKSGYDIKKLMSMSTAQFYEASYGSIYPSLERMLKSGFVESERSEGSGRLRRIFTVKPMGRKAFLQWLASPLDITKGPSHLLLRLFFMGCLERDAAKRTLKLFANSALERKKWLETVTDGLPVEPDFFQAATQGFGLDYYAFLESWLNSFCEKVNVQAKKQMRTKKGTRV